MPISDYILPGNLSLIYSHMNHKNNLKFTVAGVIGGK